MLTRIHRQHHIRMVLVSEEAFPDKVLHLCDGRTTLKLGVSTSGGISWFIVPTIECPRKCSGDMADHSGYNPDRKIRPYRLWL